MRTTTAGTVAPNLRYVENVISHCFAKVIPLYLVNNVKKLVRFVQVVNHLLMLNLGIKPHLH